MYRLDYKIKRMLDYEILEQSEHYDTITEAKARAYDMIQRGRASIMISKVKDKSEIPKVLKSVEDEK